MNPETVFSLANLLALAGWVALAALPGRRWVADVLCGTLLPATLAAAYVALVLRRWGAAQGGFSSLADVARLFESRWSLLAGWVHYLAFDLFVGSWIARDARRAAPGRSARLVPAVSRVDLSVRPCRLAVISGRQSGRCASRARQRLCPRARRFMTARRDAGVVPVKGRGP